MNNLCKKISHKITHLKTGHPYENEGNHYFLTPERGGGVSFIKDDIPIKESVKRDLLRIPFKDRPFFNSYIRWKNFSRATPEFTYFKEDRLAFLFDKNGMAIPCITPWLVQKFSPYYYFYVGLWVDKDEASLLGLSLFRIKTGGKPTAFVS